MSVPENNVPKTATIHIASSPIDGRQHCRSCGQILIDRTSENHVEGDIDVWFQPGGYVRRLPEGIVSERRLGPGDTLCTSSKEVNPCL